MTLIARHGPAWTYIDYHQFLLMKPDQQDYVPEEAGRLLSTTGEGVLVHTGIANGNVAVHIEIHDHQPPLDDADWEEVAEASTKVEHGPLMVRCLTADPPALPMLTPAGPGTYRLRAHARGRDIAYDGCVSRSPEVYLIQIWPAPRAQTDRPVRQRPAPPRTPRRGVATPALFRDR
ncbi:hypothetical protein BJY14_007725 [Actinomadura luteofluorescens]|uniref:Uncharacterized protein n=1 Tax=Actinomadura luteofluorescens TaxID=46163 RepID=A0A7Y9JJR6_9ACTN|nr:hypothetical protein [Actinomadura luteofluorescens]NYD51742.1 hypothetical protein [Actinomadura luteofluorescens]